MAAKERVNKHPDWRLSTRERFNYYLSDSGRLFGTSVFQTFMTAFLALRGVNLTMLAGALLVLKIVDAVDDVIFGYLIDKLKITEWKAFRKITGEGKYLPWFRLTFFLFPVFTVVFYLMPSGLPQGVKLAWFIVSYLLYDFSCTLNEVPMNSLIMTLTDNTDERNHIITMWQECGLEAKTAGDSQALIQLKKEYCDAKDCLRCRFGYEYLRASR